eukprot:114934-Rhodomonas_salina.1
MSACERGGGQPLPPAPPAPACLPRVSARISLLRRAHPVPEIADINAPHTNLLSIIRYAAPHPSPSTLHPPSSILDT